MKDFERIDDLQKSRDQIIQAMYRAQKKLREDAEKEEAMPNKIHLMTAALAVNEILFQYSKLVKESQT